MSMMNDWHNVVTSTMPRRSISPCQLVPALASVSQPIRAMTAVSKRRFITVVSVFNYAGSNHVAFAAPRQRSSVLLIGDCDAFAGVLQTHQAVSQRIVVD